MPAPVSSSVTQNKHTQPYWWVLTAGLVAGLLDGAAAIVQYYLNTGNGPTRIFQYIASAIFGRSAFSGGNTMVLWGVLFHLVISILFAAVFFMIFPTAIKFFKNHILAGILYGLFVWAVMNLLVVPFSNAPFIPLKLQPAIISMIILVCMVGIPISVITHRYFINSRR